MTNETLAIIVVLGMLVIAAALIMTAVVALAAFSSYGVHLLLDRRKNDNLNNNISPANGSTVDGSTNPTAETNKTT